MLAWNAQLQWITQMSAQLAWVGCLQGLITAVPSYPFMSKAKAEQAS